MQRAEHAFFIYVPFSKQASKSPRFAGRTDSLGLNKTSGQSRDPGGVAAANQH